MHIYYSPVHFFVQSILLLTSLNLKTYVFISDRPAISSSMADTEPAAESVNTTGKVPATPEGMMVAYGSLVIMSLIPIFLGSFRSVESQKEQKENHVSCDA